MEEVDDDDNRDSMFSTEFEHIKKLSVGELNESVKIRYPTQNPHLLI